MEVGLLGDGDRRRRFPFQGHRISAVRVKPGVCRSKNVKYQIVIPAYNAAGSLVELTARIRRSAPEVPVLIVDDGSTDATPEILPALGVALFGTPTIAAREGR